MSVFRWIFVFFIAFLAVASSASAGGVGNLAGRRLPPATAFNLNAPRITYYARTAEGPMRHNMYLRQGQGGLMKGIVGRLQQRNALVIRSTDVAQVGRVVAQASPRALQGGRSYMVVSEQLVIKESSGLVRAIRIDSRAAQVLESGGARADVLIERAIQRLDVQKGFPRSLTVRGESLGLDVLEPGGRSAFVVIEHNVIPRLLPGHTDASSTEKPGRNDWTTREGRPRKDKLEGRRVLGTLRRVPKTPSGATTLLPAF